MFDYALLFLMKTNPRKNLTAIDKITLLYLFVTTIFIGLAWNDLENRLISLGFRIFSILIIYLMAYFQDLFRNGVMTFVRYAYPLGLIIYLYPETDQFNNVFFNDQDPFFYRIEELIFGCQPSLVFPDRFPQLWMTELMSFGYFSYYLVIFGFYLILYIKDFDLFYRITFIILSAFYTYYLLFIILPVAGPQYFLPSPQNEVPKAYLFSSMLKLVQELGERPTGAFPSSHIGVVTIVMWYSYKHIKKWFFILLPVTILLLLSTVYLKAHYLVDVIVGLLTVPLFIIAGNRLYERISVAQYR